MSITDTFPDDIGKKKFYYCFGSAGLTEFCANSRVS